MDAMGGISEWNTTRASKFSEFLIAVGHEVSFTVHNDRGALNPFRAVFRNPGSGGPFTDVVAPRKNAGTLDVSDLDDVFVFGQHVTELLAGGTVTHRAVDVFQNFCSVPGAVAQEFLDLLTDSCGFHRFLPPVIWTRLGQDVPLFPRSEAADIMVAPRMNDLVTVDAKI